MAQGQRAMGRWPWVGAMLLLGGLIVLQGQRISSSTDRIAALESQLEAGDARVDGAVQLLEEAQVAMAIREAQVMELESYVNADALVTIPPSDGPKGPAPGKAEPLSSQALALRIRVLLKGDPDLVSPSPDGGMVVFFDELL